MADWTPPAGSVQVNEEESSWTPPSGSVLASETKSDWIPPKGSELVDESPSTLKSIAQGGVSALGATARVLPFAVAGVANKVGGLFGHPDIADPLFQAADDVRNETSTAILSKEEQSKQTLPQKILAAVPAVAPMFALGPAGAPGLAAAMGVANTGSDLIQDGATLGQAQAGGLADAATSYVGMKLPSLGSTFTRSAALGAGGNVASGMASDAIISKVMSDRPDVAAKYDPLDWEKRIVEGVTGAGFGTAFHAYNKVAVAKHGFEQAKRIQELTDGIPALENTLGEIITPRTKSGITLQELQNNPNAKVIDVYDAVVASDKARPDQKALAEALIRLHDINGHGDVPVQDHTKYLDEIGAYGAYGPKSDTVKLRKAPTDSPEAYITTALHEGIHSAVHSTLKWHADTPYNNQMSPRDKALWEKADNLKKVFDEVKGKLAKEGGKDIDAKLKDLVDIASDTTRPLAERQDAAREHRKIYGLQDVHEFVSEVFTNKHFQATLKAMKLSPLEVQTKGVKSTSTIVNAWTAVKRAIKQLVANGEPHSYLDVALEHSMNLLEHGTKMHVKRGTFRLERDLKIAAARQTNTNRYARGMLKDISDTLAHSGDDKDMFNTRLRALDKSTDWQAFVDRNLDSLWENGRRIRETVGRDRDYKNLSESDKLFQSNPLTVDEFMSQIVGTKKKLVSADDLNASGTDIMGSNVTVQLKGHTLAGKVMKFIKEKATEYKQLQAILFHDSMAKFAPYNKLDIPGKKAVMDAAIVIDGVGYRKKLQLRQLQWPDEQMLRQDFPHLTDAQIDAYQRITEGLDFLHNLMNQSRRVLGLEPVPQIPGYMPHVFDGAYKVFMTKMIDTPNGPEPRVVQVKGFKTKYGALKLIGEINAGKYGPDMGVEGDSDARLPYHVQKHGDLTTGMTTALQQHLQAYYNQLQLNPEALEVLKKIDRDSMQGFNKHELERSDIDGFIGAYGVENAKGLAILKEKMGILSGENKKILNLYENYARSVTEHYRNVLYTNEIASRFLAHGYNQDKGNFGAIFEKTKDLNKHISEFSYNFTGENLNKAAYVDEVLSRASIKLGLDPNLYRRAARDMRNLLSLIKLRVNPGNYIANVLQPAQMVSLLQYVNAARGMDGHKNPDVMTSFSTALKEIMNPSPEYAAAIKWARDNHILDAQLEPEMRGANPGTFNKVMHAATLGGINPAIEGFGRRFSFLVAFEHFKQIYPEDPHAARKAAANMMEMGMVNYDRSSRPLMYQNYGLLGEAVSPFAVFRNAYLGNSYLMLRTAFKNPTRASAYMPIVMMQLTYLATAGALGMVGAAEYDAIVNQANEWNPSLNWPTLSELLFKAKIPDHITYGVISPMPKLIPGLEEGVNIGGSMNAVGGDDIFSIAMAPFLGAIFTTLGIGVREGLHRMAPDTFDPVAGKHLFAALKQVTPSMGHKYLEDQFKDRSNIALTNSGEGGTFRTPAGDHALMIFGKKSMDEQRRNNVNLEQKKSKQQVQVQSKNLTEVAADIAMGIRTNVSRTQIEKRAEELGIELEDFRKGVVEVITKRRTTTEYREAQQETIKAKRLQRERTEMGY